MDLHTAGQFPGRVPLFILIVLCVFDWSACLPAPTVTCSRLTEITAYTAYSGATPAPWGGYGPTLWAQGPVSGVNTSAPYCWILGGSDTNSAHNQMTLFTNGAHTLLTGSSTSTTTAPSSASDPGGRVTAGRWTFNNRMYIFGGSRLYDTNDMWHFDGTGWTLVKGATAVNYGNIGVASATNWPPSLVSYGFAFDERTNIFWVHGGGKTSSQIASSGLDQDTLWSYDVVAGHWTARAGTFGDPVANPNIPPARRNGGLWIDANGDIWAYGGMTWAGTPYFFDMWKFTVSTASWALVSSISQAPVYGVQGQFSPSNTPGAREAFAYWSDPTHQLFFLFGGADNNWVTHFEDLWVYDTTQNQWAWIGGVQGSNNPDPTTYSNPGVLDRQWPLHRANLAWDVDATGTNAYIFGGQCVSLLTRDLYLFTLSGLPGLATTAPIVTTTAPPTTTPIPTTTDPLATTPVGGITTTPAASTPAATFTTTLSTTTPPAATPSSCLGAPPLGATCINGVWTVNGSVLLNGPVVLDLGNRSVEVSGNVSIGQQVQVIVTDTGSIVASGCVDVKGKITVLLNSSSVPSSVPVIKSNSSCISVDPALPEPQVNLSTSVRHYKCKTAQGAADSSDGKTLAVLITVKNHCKSKLQWWFFVAVALALIVLAGAATVVILVLCKRRGMKTKAQLRTALRHNIEL